MSPSTQAPDDGGLEAGGAAEPAGAEGRGGEDAAGHALEVLSAGPTDRPSPARAEPTGAEPRPVGQPPAGEGEGPPLPELALPRRLHLDVADPAGSWSLDIYDHGRSLDVLVRGDASLGSAVAAASVDLRAELSQAGYALGSMDFLSMERGGERGRGGHGSGGAEHRASSSAPREPLRLARTSLRRDLRTV